MVVTGPDKAKSRDLRSIDSTEQHATSSLKIQLFLEDSRMRSETSKNMFIPHQLGKAWSGNVPRIWPRRRYFNSLAAKAWISCTQRCGFDFWSRPPTLKCVPWAHLRKINRKIDKSMKQEQTKIRDQEVECWKQSQRPTVKLPVATTW